MTPLILGIDPGVSGGIAFLDPARPLDAPDVASVYTMPTIRAARGTTALDVNVEKLAKLIKCTLNGVSLAFVEQVTSRPRQAGQFAFGVNYGRVLGMLEALGIPTTHVAPSKWKQELGLRGEDKSMSVALAAELFPALRSQFFGLRGAGLDGRAEALLIAYYGSKKL